MTGSATAAAAVSAEEEEAALELLMLQGRGQRETGTRESEVKSSKQSTQEKKRGHAEQRHCA